jgi:hypothetical protein
MEIIKRNGRMKWDNPVYVDRLKTELQVIAKNGIKDLTPYFLPIVEVLDRYISEKQLPSPGRGSAGGSLLCYLLGITNINPIQWDLPFSRFFSKTRVEMRKLPDIDCLHSKTMILTDKGYLSIGYLSILSEKDYPRLASYDGMSLQYQRPVVIFKKGRAIVKEYLLDNNKTITCTPDHQVLTKFGYKTIEECYEKNIDIVDLKQFE